VPIAAESQEQTRGGAPAAELTGVARSQGRSELGGLGSAVAEVIAARSAPCARFVDLAPPHRLPDVIGS
jgi:hypothetical protein